jgi:hypothetical protein
MERFVVDIAKLSCTYDNKKAMARQVGTLLRRGTGQGWRRWCEPPAAGSSGAASVAV